jgi:hypothetical protein
MADDGPPLVRPIPRRPFGFSLTSATPPGSNDFDNFDDDSASSSTADFNSGSSYSSYSPHLSASGFLSSGLPSQDGTTLSRAQSVMNLTSSTLFGIYSPTTSSRDRVFPDRDEDDEDATPWGTGAQTPVRHPSVDQATYELMRGRSQALRRRRSSNRSADTVPHVPSPPISTATTVFSLLVRGSLLFALGIGYGALVTRFQDSAGSQWATLTEDISKSSYNRVYLAFWGASGVMLGALLPWLDEVWEEAFPGDNDIEPAAIAIDLTSSDDTGAPTDWALVMRAIGAFVGIVFAIVSCPTGSDSSPLCSCVTNTAWPYSASWHGHQPCRPPEHWPWLIRYFGGSSIAPRSDFSFPRP